MRILLISLTTLVVAMSTISLAQEKPGELPILRAALDGYIIPLHRRLNDSTKALSSDVAAFCRQPSETGLDRAQTSFAIVATSWAQLEWLRIGPAMADNRLERMLFYPDRKGTGLRQVQRALGKKDPTATSHVTLAKKSVAMQGMGALEFLLFGTGSDELLKGTTTYRCTYADAISKNLHTVSSELLNFWSRNNSVTYNWLNPSDINPWFRHEQEAVAKLVGTIVHGLEAIKDIRIGAFLRKSADRDRPKSALFWRSQQTMPMIVANLEGLKRLYNSSDLRTVLPDGADGLNSSINTEFDWAIDAARSFDRPVAELIGDPEARERLKYLQRTIKFTIERFDEEFLPALGLHSGFSFGDGD